MQKSISKKSKAIPDSSLILNNNIECKIKYSEWKPFESIGNAYNNFNDLVEFLSFQVYPNNFSVNSYDMLEGDLKPLGNSSDYNKVLRSLSKSEADLLLIVYIIPQDTKIQNNNCSARSHDINKRTEKCK